jgi:D-aminopeptidase
MTGDLTAARETLQGIQTVQMKARPLLALANVAMTDGRQHEARRLLASVCHSLDTKQRVHSRADSHQLAVDVVTLQVSMGDVSRAISRVERMDELLLKFDCFLAMADAICRH